MTPVELLQALLRIDSTNPPGNERPAAELLESHLSGAGLKCEIYRSPGGRPNLVARLEGPTDRAALVLLSHTDVVPVEPDKWTRDPFGGEVHDGHVYGRGALDMKGIAAMHAAAVSTLTHSDAGPGREVIVCAVADEETGGRQGAGWLVDEHGDAVGLSDGRPPPEVLGEGGYGLTGILERPVLPIVLGEKSAHWVKLAAAGQPAHGSMPPQKQAVADLVSVIDSLAGFYAPRVHPIMRDQLRILAGASSGSRAAVFRALASGAGPVVARILKKRLRAAGTIAALLSDTVTPTMVQAGYKENVVPSTASAALDCRLLPDTDVDAFRGRMEKVAATRGVEVKLPDNRSGPVSEPGPLYPALTEISARLPQAPVVVPSLTPGFTDVRYFRSRGATGYGWVPLVLTPEVFGTIHGHDERVPLAGFEAAVEAMTAAVRRAAATP
ncbi:MAG: M20/M25/M40 family metallo-hydrolase [Actinomycetota bacterium]